MFDFSRDELAFREHTVLYIHYILYLICYTFYMGSQLMCTYIFFFTLNNIMHIFQYVLYMSI